MYIYEGHLGSLYVSDEFIDIEDLYCEECGDSDWFVGTAYTREEAWDLLKDTDWNYEYVKEFIEENWDE